MQYSNACGACVLAHLCFGVHSTPHFLQCNLLQSKNFDILKAVKCLERNLSFFKKYRETGFQGVLVSAKELPEKLNIPAEIPAKQIRTRKRMFSYESREESVHDPLKAFEVTFLTQ